MHFLMLIISVLGPLLSVHVGVSVMVVTLKSALHILPHFYDDVIFPMIVYVAVQYPCEGERCQNSHGSGQALSPLQQ